MRRKLNPELSIIIPTLNEGKHIGELLKTLYNQTYKNFEVIIVDGNSQDNTLEVVNHFAKKLPIKVIKNVRGIGRARNKGAEIAKGDYFLFLDADVLLVDTFLEKCMNEFEERFLDCATSYVMPISDKHIDKFLHHAGNLIIGTAQYISPISQGICIFITKRLHKRIKGFDESIKLAEDVNYVERASELGKFRVLKGAKIKLSVRRLNKEGRAKLVAKYLLCGAYRALIGEVRSDIFKYEFGNHE